MHVSLYDIFNFFNQQSNKINEYLNSKHLSEMSLEEVALGFVKVANEAMCRPIRNLTEVGDSNFRTLFRN